MARRTTTISGCVPICIELCHFQRAGMLNIYNLISKYVYATPLLYLPNTIELTTHWYVSLNDMTPTRVLFSDR